MAPFKYDNRINVVFANGMSDRISPSLLDSLIRSRRIERFERAEGWVDIGVEALRGMGGPKYEGSDRRLN